MYVLCKCCIICNLSKTFCKLYFKIRDGGGGTSKKSCLNKTPFKLSILVAYKIKSVFIIVVLENTVLIIMF